MGSPPQAEVRTSTAGHDWEKKNLICWGGLTAGDSQYIGSQGVIQGTYEIFMRDPVAVRARRAATQ
jgi:urocanate hydratase